MAVSTTAVACMAHREIMPSLLKRPTNIISSNNNNVLPMAIISCFKKYNNNYDIISEVGLSRKQLGCWRFVVRSSEDGSQMAAATAAEEEEASWAAEEDTPVELPTGPPSLISALNVEKILRGIAITDVDHYARLGLRSGCSYDQVGMAYQNKVNELSTQGLDEEEYNKELDLLKESHNILSSEEERRLYDWSLSRTQAPDRYLWPFESDITQTPKGTPPPREPEDEGPTVIVGYFILGWFVLAAAMSIILNLQ